MLELSDQGKGGNESYFGARRTRSTKYKKLLLKERESHTMHIRSKASAISTEIVRRTENGLSPLRMKPKTLYINIMLLNDVTKEIYKTLALL